MRLFFHTPSPIGSIYDCILILTNREVVNHGVYPNTTESQKILVEIQKSKYVIKGGPLYVQNACPLSVTGVTW